MHCFERNTALTAFSELHVVRIMFRMKTTCCTVNAMIDVNTAQLLCRIRIIFVSVDMAAIQAGTK